MRVSVPSKRLVQLILLGVLAAAFLGIVATRLGGGGSGESAGTNANEVIDRAFSAGTFKSGKFEATIRASLQGIPGAAQLGDDVRASMSGKFENASAAGKLPEA